MAGKLYWFYGPGNAGKTTAARHLLDGLGGYCRLNHITEETIDIVPRLNHKHFLIDGELERPFDFNVIFNNPDHFDTVIIITNTEPLNHLASRGYSQQEIDTVRCNFEFRYF